MKERINDKGDERKKKKKKKNSNEKEPKMYRKIHLNKERVL